MAFLEVENLSLTIDNKKLLDNISFCVEKGTITLIAGKNGSGKSLLLKCLKGLDTPDSAKITLDGKDMKRKRDRMKDISLVFQDTALQVVGATVEKDIAFGPENLNLEQEEIDKRVNQMLTLFDLEYARRLKVDCLSGGEKRKLAIAGVLAMKPKLLLLDEPFANLDYPSTLTVIKTLDRLKEEGITVILVSHEAEKFLAHTDNTIIIKGGKIVYSSKSKLALDALRENEIYLPKNTTFEDLTWVH